MVIGASCLCISSQGFVVNTSHTIYFYLPVRSIKQHVLINFPVNDLIYSKSYNHFNFNLFIELRAAVI
jgi:hypothetical protein